MVISNLLADEQISRILVPGDRHSLWSMFGEHFTAHRCAKALHLRSQALKQGICRGVANMPSVFSRHRLETNPRDYTVSCRDALKHVCRR